MSMNGTSKQYYVDRWGHSMKNDQKMTIPVIIIVDQYQIKYIHVEDKPLIFKWLKNDCSSHVYE